MRSKCYTKEEEERIRKLHDQRTYFIRGEWVHVPNCVDDLPYQNADETGLIKCK